MPDALKPSVFSRYLLTIVMIPSIIGIHFGWSLMQKNRTLVAEHEEIELPTTTFAKYCWEEVKKFGTGDVKAKTK